MATTPTAVRRPPGGLLASVGRFDLWLDVTMVLVVLTCTIRYLTRHGLADWGVAVLAGAALLTALHLVASRLATANATATGGRWVAVAAVLGAVVAWMGLTLVAPSFAWCAVPVAFAVLRVVPSWPAIVVVVAMTVTVPVAWWRLLDQPDPTVVVGPIALAVITVVAYRALVRESQQRQRLVDELRATRDDLAEADRREGALAERARLSREIHDSVGQGLSSVALLLNAAEQQWDRDPALARRHVASAGHVSRASLEDVRRVVRDLAPAELSGDDPTTPGRGVEQALQRILDQIGPEPSTELRTEGDPVAIPPPIGTALVRTAQGALANVVEHSGATSVTVTLTRHRDQVSLDVYDDGHGFDPASLDPPGVRGHGLSGIAARVAELGGTSSVDSSPEGTIVSVSFALVEGIGHGS